MMIVCLFTIFKQSTTWRERESERVRQRKKTQSSSGIIRYIRESVFVGILYEWESIICKKYNTHVRASGVLTYFDNWWQPWAANGKNCNPHVNVYHETAHVATVSVRSMTSMDFRWLTMTFYGVVCITRAVCLNVDFLDPIYILGTWCHFNLSSKLLSLSLWH